MGDERFKEAFPLLAEADRDPVEAIRSVIGYLRSDRRPSDATLANGLVYALDQLVAQIRAAEARTAALEREIEDFRDRVTQVENGWGTQSDHMLLPKEELVAFIDRVRSLSPSTQPPTT